MQSAFIDCSVATARSMTQMKAAQAWEGVGHDRPSLPKALCWTMAASSAVARWSLDRDERGVVMFHPSGPR